MGHPVRIDNRGVGREIGDAIRRRSREPIVELLALFLSAAPSPEAFEEMVRRDPGKWIKSIVLLAGLMGYGARREVDVSPSAAVGSMSDSQLEEALAVQMAKLELAPGGRSELRQLPVPDTSASST